jgi:hypothetical protein
LYEKLLERQCNGEFMPPFSERSSGKGAHRDSTPPFPERKLKKGPHNDMPAISQGKHSIKSS